MTKKVHEIITDQIIDSLESASSWSRSWTITDLPRNLISNNYYNGINLLLLSLLNYKDPRFLTFKQAKKLNGHVNKGESGHIICYYSRVTKEDEDKSYALLRYYRVFNVEQCTLPNLKPVPISEPVTDSNESAERILQLSPIEHGNPAYSPDRDIIKLPHKYEFESVSHYYATATHEFVHWTGHKSRLNRDLRNKFGSDTYAYEELIAELGSAFTNAHSQMLIYGYRLKACSTLSTSRAG